MKTLPTSPAFSWGTTVAERMMSFPCDHFLTSYDETYFRAVTVQAPAPIIYRWLCQLRVAPYSYDWIDNGGRKSPLELIPELDQLQVGQRVMTIFELVDFEANRHLTLRLRSARATAVFGEVAISYIILPVLSKEDATQRLVAKLLVRYPPGFTGAIVRRWLPWGDLVMMRKQLLTFKYLAERQSSAALRA